MNFVVHDDQSIAEVTLGFDVRAAGEDPAKQVEVAFDGSPGLDAAAPTSSLSPRMPLVKAPHPAPTMEVICLLAALWVLGRVVKRFFMVLFSCGSG